MPYVADYFDGKTARRHGVVVAVAQRGLRVRLEDGQELLWPWAEIRHVKEAYAGDPLRLERIAPDDAGPALVFADAAILEAIARANPHAAKAFAKPAGMGTVFLRTVGATVGCAAFLGVALTWGVPMAGAAAAPLVPVAWEKDLGAEVRDQIVAVDDRCGDEEKVRALEAILGRLVAARGKTPYTYSVTLSKESQVNAFAAPGGFVVVNQGLLAKMKRPEALAGVLAHEVQHVEQRHTTKAICREYAMSGVLNLVFGGGLGLASGAAHVFSTLSYSRDAETEADREGMKLMIAAGIDPQGMVESFQMLEDEDAGEEPNPYLSTHPRTSDRVALLRKLARAAKTRPQPVMLATPWKRVIAGCGGR